MSNTNQPGSREKVDENTTYVVTYFRKGTGLLKQCLNSIQRACVTGDVIIVVDDASEDEVEEFVRVSFPQVRYLGLSINVGPGEARNLAINLVETDFIQFVDADDLIHPERARLLSKQLRSNSDEPFVSAQFSTFSGNFEFHEISSCEFKWTPTYAVPYLPVAGLFRTSFIRSVGPFDSSRRWMDLSFHARIISLVPSHLHTSLPLYAYRKDVGGQISSITLDTDGYALRSFLLARSFVDEKTAQIWLYPLATALARQSLHLPMGRNKIKALSQPVALAPTSWTSLKWLMFAVYASLKLPR